MPPSVRRAPRRPKTRIRLPTGGKRRPATLGRAPLTVGHKTPKVLQINICGLVPNILELNKVLLDRAIDIALIQEALIGKKRSANVSGYSFFRCKCSNCRGLVK